MAFGRKNKKSPYCTKIENILQDEIVRGFGAVTSPIHEYINSTKRLKKITDKKTTLFEETQKRGLVKYDEAVKFLIRELEPLKAKNKVALSEVEKGFAEIRKKFFDVENYDQMGLIKDLGEVFNIVRKGIEGM